MNPGVRLTSAAERDLAEQAAYLGRDNPEVGERFLITATRTFHDLLGAPATGEEFRSKKSALRGLRVWRVRNFSNHVFVFRDSPEGILVVRLFHAAQDWQRLLEGDAE